VVAGLAVILLFVRVFLVGLYHVDSGSMEPTVHGSPERGEYLAVRYGDAADLERFDLVALLPGGGESSSRIKRVVALPGESVALHGGDVWIDGAPLPPGVPRPAQVLVFDQARMDIEMAFRFTDAWTLEGGRLELDASSVPSGAGRGLLYMRQVLKDDYLDASGRRVEGKEVVGDATLELEVTLENPPAKLRFGLLEKGDVFEVRLTPTDAGAVAQLTRRNIDGEQLLAEETLAWSAGAHRVRFENRDNHLSFVVDGAVAVEASYPTNAFLASDHAKRGFSAPTDRVFFGGEEGRASFQGVRVLRDLHYTPRGAFGIDEPLQLGPNELFVLGDNSSDSRDGRDWGATPRTEVLGKPLGVIWPPSGLRLLTGPSRE
jgi:signal peptidase I